MKIREFVKKFFIWLGTVSAAVLTVLLIHKRSSAGTFVQITNEDREKEKIEQQACSKREEVLSNIHNTPAANLAEEYPAVRTAINRGIERFRKRCKQNN